MTMHHGLAAILAFVLLPVSVSGAEVDQRQDQPAAKKDSIRIETEADEAEAENQDAEEAETGDRDKEPRLSYFEIMPLLRALKSKNSDKRKEAFAQLAAAREDTGWHLREHLRRYSTTLRRNCIPLLEKINNRHARIALVARAVYDKDKQVRKQAGRALRDKSGATVKKYLMKRAFSQKENTRQKTARAISNIQDPTIVDVLLEATKVYYVGRVRTRAKVSAYDPANSRSRTFVFQGTVARDDGGGTRAIATKHLPVQMPVTKTTQVETTVWTFFEVIGKDPESMTLAEVETWWKKRRDNFDWPNAE